MEHGPGDDRNVSVLGAMDSIVGLPRDEPPGVDDVLVPGSTPSSSRGSSRWLIEWVAVVVVVIALTLVLRMLVVQTFEIPSGSMLPTLQIGDRITVDKLSYDLHGVHRGDIVVFNRPALLLTNESYLVKRVVGLPGETISARNGQVYIDGKLLAQPWLPKGPQSYTGPLAADTNPRFNMPGPVTIPAGHLFVMGDDRTDSEDSRYFGPIPESSIVGRAFAVVWPLSQIKGV